MGEIQFRWGLSKPLLSGEVEENVVRLGVLK